MSDDKFVLDYSRRRHSSGQAGHEVSREDMLLKNYQGDFEKGLKNVVGPAFIMCGMYGFFAGIFQSARSLTFRNRPKKLIVTSVINTVGKQSSFFANAGASLGLIYCINKKGINFLFDEELQNLSETGKQIVYGFCSGAMFKCTRGILPALLSGIICASFCGGVSYFYEKSKML
jgi:hypothetical protein